MGLALSKTTGVTYSGMWSEGVKKGEATLILEMERALPENSTRALAIRGSYDWGMVGLLILIKMKTGIGGTGSSIRPLARIALKIAKFRLFVIN